MIKYRNILVVIDPNMEAQPALYRAAEVARLQDSATIKVFMSIYDFSYEITSILSVEERDEMREGVVAQRRAWLEGLIQPYLDEGLDMTLKVVWHSRPSESILNEVNQHGHDLVIKSAHQHSLLESFIFTPLDWQLIRKCHLPVLLVKEHDWPVMAILSWPSILVVNQSRIHSTKNCSKRLTMLPNWSKPMCIW